MGIVVSRRAGATLVALVLVAALWGVWRWRMRDEAVVRRSFSRLITQASFDGPAQRLSAATYAARVSQWFTDKASLDVAGVRHLYGRSDIRAAAFQARSRASSLALSASDVHVSVDGDEAALNAWVLARMAWEDRREHSREPVDLRWVRTDEGWRIASASRYEVIRRPEGL